MITDINKDFIVQKCDCGSFNHVHFEKIKYIKHKKSSQFVLPLCTSCKQRIEFLIIGEQMKELELKLYYEMNSRGLIK